MELAGFTSSVENVVGAYLNRRRDLAYEVGLVGLAAPVSGTIRVHGLSRSVEPFRSLTVLCCYLLRPSRLPPDSPSTPPPRARSPLRLCPPSSSGRSRPKPACSSVSSA